MCQLVSVLFERELTRRGVSFSFDHESARYRIEHRGGKLLVSLDNLARAYNRDRDQSRIASFVDAVLGSRFESRPWPEAQPSILFALEPSDHVEPSDLRTPLSKQVDRVPVVYTLDASPETITWITQSMLDGWNISLAQLETTASANLAAALAAAKVAHTDIGGVRLGIIETDLACKAALILAPNRREVVSPTLGWPLFASPIAISFICGGRSTVTSFTVSAEWWSGSLRTRPIRSPRRSSKSARLGSWPPARFLSWKREPQHLGEHTS